MAMKSNFSIKIEERGQIVVVFVEGFLDDTAGQNLILEVGKKLEANFNRFVFDFKNVRNVSSPAVAAILDLSEKITDNHSGKVIISGLSDLNLKIFEMVGIFLYADACATTQEAEVKVSL